MKCPSYTEVGDEQEQEAIFPILRDFSFQHATVSLVSPTGNSLAKSQDENGKEFECGDAEGEEAKNAGRRLFFFR
jgi:hypothetical protein